MTYLVAHSQDIKLGVMQVHKVDDASFVIAEASVYFNENEVGGCVNEYKFDARMHRGEVAIICPPDSNPPPADRNLVRLRMLTALQVVSDQLRMFVKREERKDI